MQLPVTNSAEKISLWYWILRSGLSDKSCSQQEQHHYFIHLWACGCIDTRQIIFLINQCSTLDITQKVEEAHCSQRHSGGTGGSGLATTSHLAGLSHHPLSAACNSPHTFAIPLNGKTMQWKQREEKQVFKHATIITTYKIRENRHMMAFTMAYQRSLCWMGQCRWQLKIRPSSPVISGRRHNGMKAVISFSFLVYQCCGTTGSFTAENQRQLMVYQSTSTEQKSSNQSFMRYSPPLRSTHTHTDYKHVHQACWEP